MILEAARRLVLEGRISWKKVHKGYVRKQSRKAGGRGSGMVKTYEYHSPDGRFEITQSTHAPGLGYAHKSKKLYWRIWDKKRNRTWPGHYANIAAAQDHVEKILSKEAHGQA